MSDTISRALELAMKSGEGSAATDLRSERAVESIYPKARPVIWSQLAMEESRLITGSPTQQIMDCYSLLRTRVLHRVRQHRIQTIGITSPAPRDGKSLTSTNLALSIAMGESHPVVLIDADVRRPTLAGLFGIEPEVGLGDYFMDEASLEDLLLKLPQKGMYLIPGRAQSRLRPEALSSDKVLDFTLRLKRMFPNGLLIFDMPPALVGGDVVAFAPNLDATLIVVANRRTLEKEIQQTMTVMEDVNVIGTVLNFAEETISRNEYYKE
ncbi:MAG: CpsD/CapB family tyrosine-protein kinase [Ectothiorhodospiraceae bacterium]|nr:CpsD/CapB family tyrosine-protein kinase [Ectothiorhodospiraceae bacterium]